MIHTLRILTGIVMLYLLTSFILFMLYFADNDLDRLPWYIKIPGAICWAIVFSIPVLITVYVFGCLIIG